MQDKIKILIKESAEVILTLDPQSIQNAALLITDAYKSGNKVLVFGNGGSAADAQHFAAELIARFKKERRSCACIALTTDTSVITAIGNDYSFEYIFKRQLEGLLKKGDVVIGISTSGESLNVIHGIEYAKSNGGITIGLTGKSGGRLKEIVDVCIHIKSSITPYIQQAHITALHILCELIEEALFT